MALGRHSEASSAVIPKPSVPSFPRKRESILLSPQQAKWIPAFAGMTVRKWDVIEW